MTMRPKLIQAGKGTLDSIPRIQRASGVQFFCPPLKGVDNKTQERVTKWFRRQQKFPAHVHSLDLNEAQAQRCPGVEQLQGMKTRQLLDKYTVKRNNIRNHCTLLQSVGEEGIQHYLAKHKEITNAFDKLLHTWEIHGSPLGDRKVKETIFQDR